MRKKWMFLMAAAAVTLGALPALANEAADAADTVDTAAVRENMEAADAAEITSAKELAKTAETAAAEKAAETAGAETNTKDTKNAETEAALESAAGISEVGASADTTETVKTEASADTIGDIAESTETLGTGGTGDTVGSVVTPGAGDGGETSGSVAGSTETPDAGDGGDASGTTETPGTGDTTDTEETSEAEVASAEAAGITEANEGEVTYVISIPCTVNLGTLNPPESAGTGGAVTVQSVSVEAKTVEGLSQGEGIAVYVRDGESDSADFRLYGTDASNSGKSLSYGILIDGQAAGARSDPNGNGCLVATFDEAGETAVLDLQFDQSQLPVENLSQWAGGYTGTLRFYTEQTGGDGNDQGGV